MAYAHAVIRSRTLLVPLCAGVTALVVSAGARASTAAPRVATELPAPADTSNAHAAALNDSGLIVGWTRRLDNPVAIPDGWPRPVVWRPNPSGGDPVPSELPNVDGTTDTTDWGQALGVNRDGQIVGWSEFPGATVQRAVLWSPGPGGSYGRPLDLGAQFGPTLPATEQRSGAVAINNSGQIVGWADTPDLPGHPSIRRAVIWTRAADGSYRATDIWNPATDRLLPTTGEPSVDLNDAAGVSWRNSGAAAINDAGVIVGELDNDARPAWPWELNPLNPLGDEVDQQAVVWKPASAGAGRGGVPDPTGSVPPSTPAYNPYPLRTATVGHSSQAVGINSAGVIVGRIGDQAAVWTPAPPLAQLPAPAVPGAPPPPAGAPSPSVSASPTGSLDSPYGTTMLPPLPQLPTGSRALAISDSGQIAGVALRGDAPTATYAVTWLPPAPGDSYSAPVPAAVYTDGPYSEARSINSRGEMVGDVHPLLTASAQDLLGYQAAVWMPTSVPGPPRTVTATPGDREATVAFDPPETDGGSPVLHYTVTSRPEGHTATGATGPLTVDGLTNGVDYSFTVTATNAVGTGPPSAGSNVVTPDAAWLPGDSGFPWLFRHHHHHLGFPGTGALGAGSSGTAPAAPTGAQPPPAPAAGSPPLQPVLRGTLASGSWTTPARLPLPGYPRDDPGVPAGDRFVLELTAMVLVPAALIVLVWTAWEQGWWDMPLLRLAPLRRRPR